jgi:hypothetical protein
VHIGTPLGFLLFAPHGTFGSNALKVVNAVHGDHVQAPIWWRVWKGHLVTASIRRGHELQSRNIHLVGKETRRESKRQQYFGSE